MLLDKGVVRHRIDLQTGGQRYGPQRAVQRHGDVVGFSHGGDLAGFGDTAGVRDIGLDDVDVALAQDSFEIPARKESLTQSDGGVGQGGKFLECLVVFAQDRLLDEHQLVLVQFLDQDLGHRLVDPTMKVDADADVGTDGVAHRRHIGQCCFHFFIRIDELQFFGSVHLDCRKPTRHRILGGGGNIGRTVATNPGVDADAVAQRAAQQLTYRDAECLALDIPQRLIDTGQRTHVDGAAAIKAATVQHGPVILDVARVLANKIVGQFFNRSRHAVCPPLNHRFAPAEHTFIGFYFQKTPARRNNVRSKFGDLHGLIESDRWMLLRGLPRSDEFVGTLADLRCAQAWLVER